VFWILAVVLALLAAGLIYQWVGERRDARRFPAPGRIVSGLHVYQTGSGQPPVILEAGIAASSLSWRLVQECISRETTVASYDRAGFAWSPVPSAPRTLPNLVEDLRRLLEACGLQGPFILVGHSFGGLLLRHFAAAHPHFVKALVLADPLDPCEWHPVSAEQSWRLGKGVMLSRRGATLARYGVVRLALDLLMAGSLVIPKFLAKATSGRGSVVPDRIVGEIRKLPPEVWPAIRAHWCLRRSFLTMAEYIERIPEFCATPIDEKPLRDIPLTVISAARNSPEVIAAHRRTAMASTRGVHLIAENSGHWVQLDRPDLIAEAVRTHLRAGATEDLYTESDGR